MREQRRALKHAAAPFARHAEMRGCFLASRRVSSGNGMFPRCDGKKGNYFWASRKKSGARAIIFDGMSVGEEGGGEEGHHTVTDLGEAGSEDTVVVEVERRWAFSGQGTCSQGIPSSWAASKTALVP